jgi:acetyltransferase-like isoleucine patch superfamily enzyme
MMRKLIRHIATLASFVMRYKLIKVFWFIRNELNSAIVKRELKKCGSDFRIYYPTILKGGQYISIGDDFDCYSRLRIEAYDKYNSTTFSPEIHIGNGVGINYDCHIACINKVIIGNNVLMASRVFITDHYHGEIDAKTLRTAPRERDLVSPGEVVIEDNVWIGEGVAIMPGVTIGQNSVIGANAVVTKSIPAYSVAAGVPARVLRILHGMD